MRRRMMVALLRATALVGSARAAEPAQPAVPPTQPTATSLDELLEKARGGQAARRELDREREREFLADRERQATLLETAKRELAEATARSKELSAQQACAHFWQG